MHNGQWAVFCLGKGRVRKIAREKDGKKVGTSTLCIILRFFWIDLMVMGRTEVNSDIKK